MMNCPEYGEIIAAHVDGVLSPEEELAVQSHLNQCRKCAQKFLWETEVKKSLKGRLSPLSLRPGVKERLFDQLGDASKDGLLSWFYTPYKWAAAFALLLLVVVPDIVWQSKVQNEILTNAITQYQNVTRGIIDAAQPSSSSIPPARILDLSPWGYDLLAKRTQRFKGQEGRIFVYQGQEKEYLLAQEFDKGDYSLPSGATTIRVSGRDFVSYSKGGVNLIGWKEKDILCILTSNLPRDKLLRLAQEVALRS